MTTRSQPSIQQRIARTNAHIDRLMKPFADRLAEDAALLDGDWEINVPADDSDLEGKTSKSAERTRERRALARASASTLYRLDDINSRPVSMPVYLCDMEADADELVRLPALATAVEGGKWPKDLSALKGRRVYLLSSDDGDGRFDVAAQEHLHDIAEIVPIHISGSVSDWIAKLGTQERLMELSGVARPASIGKAANDNQPAWPGLVSSGDMVRGFTPPDYAIDGIMQAGFLYSLTASTGTGKTAIALLLASLKARGLPLGNREVPAGRVIYFAGENPDDVTMRWIGAAHHAGFNTDAIDVHFVPGVFDIAKLHEAVAVEVERVGGAAMVIIDTSAAYFTGDDENSNTALGKHARNLRQLTTLKGSPCVLVACHPVKNADQSNLLPRGGGAFIAEVDGNLTCQKSEGGTVKLHWQGKFRGPDFKPIHFDLTTVTAPSLVDSKGREIPTVMASLVTDGETRQRRETARKDEDLVLIAIENLGKPSNAAIADHLGWQDAAGETHKRRAQTAVNKLRKEKLVDLDRDGWTLTAKGKGAVGGARTAHAAAERMGVSIAAMVANSTAKIDRTKTERTGGYGSTDSG